MQPVEVPDYSGFFAFVTIALAVATVICALTKTKADSKITRILKSVSFYLEKNNVTRGNKVYVSKQSWNNALKTFPAKATCGFSRPGMWECRCGKSKCNGFGNLCEAIGGTDATPPVHPTPDRRAAIEHSRNK